MPQLLAILWFLVCVASCLGYGRLWLRLLRYPHPADRLGAAYALALGMGTLAYLVLALGLMGGLTKLGIGTLVTLGCALLAVCFSTRFRQSAETAPQDTPPETPRSPVERVLAGGVLLLVAVMLGSTLIGAFRPVDGLEWDSLSYHLAAPKIYLQQGRISHIAYDSHTNFPFTMGMLYTVGLAFAGPTGAKLFHWLAGWSTCLALGLWVSRRTVNGQRAPLWTGPLAAGFFAGMPIVLWEMGTAYVDLGTALFQFLSLTALVDGVRFRTEGERQVPQGVDSAALVLAGALTGFALGTKYTALLQFGLLGLGLLFLLARVGAADRKQAFAAVMRFGLVGALVASPWYLKNWFWVHNPVHPFFFSLFKQSFSWDLEAADAYSGEQSTFGMGRSLRSSLALFWNLSVHGRDFYINQRILTGDLLGSLGPWWAGLVPLLTWARGLGWKAWALLLYSLASIGMWFFLSQQSRYLLPAFAPLAAVLALCIAALPYLGMRVAAGVFSTAALCLGLTLHRPLVEVALPVVTGQRSEANYLDETLPGLYEAAQWVNQLPPTSRVALYQETRGYYFNRPYFWANPLQHTLIPYAQLSSGEALAANLKRFGITHVLINYDFSKGVEDSKWYRLLMDGIQTGQFRPAFGSNRAEQGRRGVVVYELK